MIVPDVNLLIYAYHANDPRHLAAKTWWESAIGGERPIGLSWIAIGGFVRLMTHSRVLVNPMPVAVATDHVRSWIDQSNVVVITPGTRFANIFLRFLDATGTGGNLTTNAHLAALSVENQAELHSVDADFARFPGLKWKNPIRT